MDMVALADGFGQSGREVNPDLAQQFMARLYANTEAGYANLFGVSHATGRRQTAWAPVDDLTSLTPAIQTLGAQGDLWIGVAARYQILDHGQRGKASDCRSISALWLDVDIAGTGHKAHNLPPDYATAVELVRRFQLPPDIVVHSGYGIQCYWQLNEDVPASEADGVLKQWAATWLGIAKARGYQLDSVWNIDRIMRLPGTFNWKGSEPVPVTMNISPGAGGYQLSDIVDLLLPEPEPEVRGITKAYTGHLPGTRFNEAVPCWRILAKHGWTHTKTDAFTNDQHWKRPGTTQDRSATIYGDDGRCAVWSETVAAETGLQTRWPEPPFGLWTWLDHHGDFKAAHHQLATTGIPADLLDPEADWEEPVPLRSHPDVPGFPSEVLPSWLGSMARTVATATQTPVDLAALTGLAAVSVAMGGAVSVEVKSEWLEPANLWAVTAMPPGSGKTPAVGAHLSPFIDHEVAEKARIGLEQATAEALRKAAQKRLDRLVNGPDAKTKPENQPSEDETKDAITEAAKALAAIVVPSDVRLLVDDATPEAMATLMAENHGRIGVLTAEGGDLFDVAGGRYTGGETNSGIMIRGHSGDPYRADRKGRPAEFIAHPALTLGVAVQPQVLRKLGTVQGFTGRGLLARPLYSLPISLVGKRDTRAAAMNAGIVAQYRRMMADLIRTGAGWQERQTMTMTPDAYAVLEAFRDRLEPRLGDRGDMGSLPLMQEWGNKLAGQTARVAAILILAEYHQRQDPMTIDRTAMEAAVRLSEDYFIPHARAAFTLMGQDTGTMEAEAILGWLTRTKLETFSRRDAYRAHQSRFAQVADIDGPLGLLEDLGWIRSAPSPGSSPKGGRRPSQTYTVHPYLTPR